MTDRWNNFDSENLESQQPEEEQDQIEQAESGETQGNVPLPEEEQNFVLVDPPSHQPEQPATPEGGTASPPPPAGQGYTPYPPVTPYGQPGTGYPYQSPYQQQPYSQGGYGQQQPPAYGAPVQYLADRQGKPQTKKNKGLWVLIVVLALVIVAGVVGIALSVGRGSLGAIVPTTEAVTQDSNLPSLPIQESEVKTPPSGDLLTAEQVAEKLKPSNVGIVIYAGNNQIAGEGSGIIMTADGYIITCAHVISNAGNYRIKVFNSNNDEFDAKIVGFDARSDIGVLKVDGVTDFVPAEFGDSDSLKVGEQVVAIGNPGGMSFFGSVTNGIVSAIDRPVSSQIGYSMKCIQHNAAINPGNSGGMLSNMRGQVIGINSSKIASSSYEGMGFAIPITSAKSIIDSLIQNGYVKDRAKLGITYVAASSDYYYSMVVKLYGLPDGTVVVNTIESGSDLANYDVKQEDMIIAVNDQKLTDSGQLVDTINSLKPGDSLTLTVVRINNETQQKQENKITCKLIEDTGSSTGGMPPVQETPPEESQNPFGDFPFN